MGDPSTDRVAEGPEGAEGACGCGAVAFAVDGPLADVYVCHCSLCRRFTGSGGIAVVVVEKERLRWIRGEGHVATWRRPGADWQCWFCPTCGSPLPGENDPARVFIPAGLLHRGADGLRVAHHIHVASKAAWEEIGDGGRQHAEGLVR